VALRPALSNGLPVASVDQDAVKRRGAQGKHGETAKLVAITMANEPRNLSELMSAGPFARLLREAQCRRMETARIRALLPAEESVHLVSATTAASGELVLVMDSPSWAARVRYLVGSLPNARVKVRVLPRGG
jgi:hypothetical protein